MKPETTCSPPGGPEGLRSLCLTADNDESCPCIYCAAAAAPPSGRVSAAHSSSRLGSQTASQMRHDVFQGKNPSSLPLLARLHSPCACWRALVRNPCVHARAVCARVVWLLLLLFILKKRVDVVCLHPPRRKRLWPTPRSGPRGRGTRLSSSCCSTAGAWTRTAETVYARGVSGCCARAYRNPAPRVSRVVLLSPL